jgi:hypothetical protein
MALHSHKFTSYNSSFLPVPCIWSMPSLHMIKMLYGIPNANVFWQVHFATLPTVWSIILHHFFSPFLVDNYGWGRDGGLGISAWEEHMKIPRRKTRYVSKQAKHPTCVLNHPCFCKCTLCTLICFLWWGHAFCYNTDTRPLASLQLQQNRSSFACRQAQYWMPVPPFRAASSAKKYCFVFFFLSLSHTHKFQPFFLLAKYHGHEKAHVNLYG